jgi:hypothetical protein
MQGSVLAICWLGRSSVIIELWLIIEILFLSRLSDFFELINRAQKFIFPAGYC